MKNRISTLVFDYGGVIVNLDMANCIRKFEALGFVNVSQHLSNFGQKGFFMQFENGEIDTPTFRNYVRNEVGTTRTDSEIDEAWCAFLVDIPAERIALLRELRKNYNLLLLSNTNPLHIEVSTKRILTPYQLSLNDLFDRCYLSYEMKQTKPSPEIFQSLLADAGVVAGECLFLDDGPKNIETALQLGFHTYRVTQGQDLSFLLTDKFYAAY